MSTFDTIATDMTAVLLCDGQLGESVTYRGRGVEVTTVAVIDRLQDLLAMEVTIGDPRYVAMIDRSDVTAPRRGDQLVREDGTVWSLQEEMPGSDEWVGIWSITKQ